MSLSRVGSSPGYYGLASTTQNVVFTADSGNFQYGDILIYGTFIAAASLSLNGADAIIFHTVDALEAGSPTVTLAVPIGSGSDVVFAPGVAIRGGTTSLGQHGTLASAANGNGLDDIRTASGASPRAITLPSHATGLSPTGTQELVTYTMAGTDTGIGGGASFDVGAPSTGTDLGHFQYAPFGTGIRSAYTLSAPTTEVAVTYNGTWTGGGSHRGYGARRTYLVHLDQGGPTAVLSMSGGTPSLTVTADFSASSDPDEGLNDAVYCTIDWGDGNTSGPVPKSTNTLNHTYALPGVYSVTLTATDLYGHSGVAGTDISAGIIAVVNDDAGDQGWNEYWEVYVGSSADALVVESNLPYTLGSLADVDDNINASGETDAYRDGVLWNGTAWVATITLDGGSP